MRILYFFVVSCTIAFASCFSSPEQVKNSNAESNNPKNTVNKVDEKVTPSPTNEMADIVTPTPVATKEAAVTLRPLVEKFCKARKDKDEAALRKLYSAATLRVLIADAAAEGKRSLVEYLASEPVGDKCTVFNERIVGNTGEATFSTETYPNGIKWTFVKENGEWKFTDQSSDFKKVKQDSK
jgi:hypothetical protein